MSLEKTLKNLQDEWEGAEERKGEGFSNLPDADYVLNVASASVEFSKNDRLQVVWKGKVAEGKLEGKSWAKFDGIEDGVGMGWLKGTMAMLGIEMPKKFKDLPAAFEEFFDEHKKGINVNATVATKGEYTNIYFNGLAEEEAETGSKSSKAKEEAKEKSKESKEKTVDIDDMTFKQMKLFIKENDIDLDPKDYDDEDELGKALKKYLKKQEEKKDKKSRFAD